MLPSEIWGHCTPLYKSKPPAKPEVLIWPYKGLLLASPSRGTEFFFVRILCPTARKRAITITGEILLVVGFITCHELVSLFL